MGEDSSEKDQGMSLREITSHWFFQGLIVIVLLFYMNSLGHLTIYQVYELTLTYAIVRWMKAQTNATELQAEAARESTLASRESIKSAVAPRLIFRIRPANDYWKGPQGIQPSSWEPGVGIYIENIGLGPALNVKLSYKAVGEIDEQRCESEFIRLLPGTTYVLPSKQYPQLEVKETHKKIVIESVDYDDIRNPPNHYTIDEPIILELNPAFFDESKRDFRAGLNVILKPS